MKIRYKIHDRMMWNGKPLWVPLSLKHQFTQEQGEEDPEQHLRVIEHFHAKGFFVEWEFV